ncbi:MAG: hypothetical protein IJV27_06300 [Prevotella sp.]|nr:hypothetical protein [Prevotella sp.]
MKKLLLLWLLALPGGSMAEETADTTVTYRDKTIVLKEDSARELSVEIYQSTGKGLTKVRESHFVEGREIERVFVGSPFIPSDELQNMKFRPHYPTLWGGWNYVVQHFGSSRTDAVHGRKWSSFEFGTTPFAFAQAFNKAKTWGIAGGVQLAYVRNCFRHDVSLGWDGGRYSFAPLSQGLKTNYMDYVSVRVPVSVQMQEVDGFFSEHVGLSLEYRIGGWYHSRPYDGNGHSQSCHINHFGLNIDFGMSFGCVSLNAGFGLTPLFKTADGRKALPVSMAIGADIWELGRILKGHSGNRRR